MVDLAVLLELKVVLLVGELSGDLGDHEQPLLLFDFLFLWR